MLLKLYPNFMVNATLHPESLQNIIYHLKEENFFFFYSFICSESNLCPIRYGIFGKESLEPLNVGIPTILRHGLREELGIRNTFLKKPQKRKRLTCKAN